MQICQMMGRACCGNNLFSIFISNSYQNKIKISQKSKHNSNKQKSGYTTINMESTMIKAEGCS